MASSNATLTQLWVDDAQGSPIKIVATTPSRTSNSGVELKEDVMKFYKDAGLEPVAKEAGILDSNGDLTEIGNQNVQPRGTVQMIALPMNSMVTPTKSPLRMEQAQVLRTSSSGQPMILGTPQRVINAATHVISPKPTPYGMAPIQVESPHTWGVRKRPLDIEGDYGDGKRGKKGEKGGKGLRHFSMKVCEKVQKKGVTSYNEVADELVHEFSDPRTISPTDQAYDQKNIRRRVYDALNVLMAMNIISKKKKVPTATLR